jgi:hypothetical protein
MLVAASVGSMETQSANGSFDAGTLADSAMPFLTLDKSKLRIVIVVVPGASPPVTTILTMI